MKRVPSPLSQQTCGPPARYTNDELADSLASMLYDSGTLSFTQLAFRDVSLQHVEIIGSRPAAVPLTASNLHSDRVAARDRNCGTEKGGGLEG